MCWHATTVCEVQCIIHMPGMHVVTEIAGKVRTIKLNGIITTGALSQVYQVETSLHNSCVFHKPIKHATH